MRWRVSISSASSPSGSGSIDERYVGRLLKTFSFSHISAAAPSGAGRSRIVEASKKLAARADASSRGRARHADRVMVAGRGPHRPNKAARPLGEARQPTQAAPRDQRYESAYLFGAVCPGRGVGAALALPYVDTDMMQLHLDEISRNVAEGAHAVLLLDRAGWHTTGKLDLPDNITPIFLPSRAPELNPVENVWQYLRQNWLSNRVFEDYDAIVDAACDAWRRLIADPARITSIGIRDWAHVGQSL